MSGPDAIVRGHAAGTIAFAVTAVLAAVFFTTALQWVGAITALTLFGIGVFCFLWAYVHAVQRSRTDDISVTGLYLLAGPATPPAIRRAMLALLAAQVTTAAATTFARLEGPDGKPGSSLAVGFLVPMFGFGLNGLWATYHGVFPPRRTGGDVAAQSCNDSHESATGETPIGQNDAHG
ncbi:MAG: hypothetical protein ACRD0G_04625 [Acidimicrobiales bacterium]